MTHLFFVLVIFTVCFWFLPVSSRSIFHRSSGTQSELPSSYSFEPQDSAHPFVMGIAPDGTFLPQLSRLEIHRDLQQPPATPTQTQLCISLKGLRFHSTRDTLQVSNLQQSKRLYFVHQPLGWQLLPAWMSVLQGALCGSVLQNLLSPSTALCSRITENFCLPCLVLVDIALKIRGQVFPSLPWGTWTLCMTVDVFFLLSQQFSKQASSACSRTISKCVYARAGEEKKTCFSSDSSSLVFLLCICIVLCAKRLVSFVC